MNPTDLPPACHRPRLFVLGDSISLHYGPHLELALRGDWDYERKRGREGNLDEGVGANGGDSSMVRRYLAERKASGGIRADWILFNCGLHDIKSTRREGRLQVALREYITNLHAVVATLRELGLRPVWVRTTPVVEVLHNAVPGPKDFDRFVRDVMIYNGAADQVMTDAGIPRIDLYTFTLPMLPDGTYDGVHFSEEVRARQGEFIARELRRITGD